MRYVVVQENDLELYDYNGFKPRYVGNGQVVLRIEDDKISIPDSFKRYTEDQIKTEVDSVLDIDGVATGALIAEQDIDSVNDIDWKTVEIDRPDSVTDEFTYKNESGAVVEVITITYTNTTKKDLLSVARS